MPIGRMALWVASLGAIALGVRSVVRGPIPIEVAVLLVAGYVSLVVAGVLIPRLQMFGDVAWRGSDGSRHVALTFDDGPEPASTPLVLEQLAAAGVRATFFVIGEKAEKHPELVRAIFAAGHELGIHGHSHRRFYAFLSPARVKEDLLRAGAAVERATGVRPRWFRPPVGQASPRTFEGARRAGVSVVGWSLRAFDGLGRATPEAVARRIASGLRPGAILLLHDASERGDRVPAGVLALPRILSAMRERGLTGVPVGELIGTDLASDAAH